MSGLTCWKCVGEECSGENFEEYSEKIHCEQGESCMVGRSIKIIAIIKNRQTILVILYSRSPLHNMFTICIHRDTWMIVFA